MSKSRWLWCGIFFLLMLPSLVYLVSRATREESWDDWGFGSAQTMLTARYWTRDGFLENKFLFLPAGYHPKIKILDKPEFQFLASGIATGGLIGKRVYYTHYPSLYLVPYGLLAKFGAESRFWFRALALLFSFSSVAFMAGFIYLVTKRNIWVALLAVFYYITSSNFLGYADSLSNTPVDDLLKWAILFLSFYFYYSAVDERKKKIGKVFIWIIYFILSLSSYDSTFFVFFWLCALEFFKENRINFKKIFIWSLAPISAFIIQMGQNIWYLGLKDAALDVWGTFLFRFSATPQVGAGLNALPFGIKNLFLSLSTIGYFSDLRTRFALPLIIVLAYLFFRHKFIDWNISRYIVVLAIGGLLYPFLLPSAAAFGYQGRQVAPALLLLFSLAAWKLLVSLKENNFWKGNLLVLFCLIVFLTAHFYGLFLYVREWPNNVIEKEKIEYWGQLIKITDANTMIFGIPKNIAVGSNSFFEQYYLDRPTFSFKNLDLLLEYMDKIYSTIPGKVNFLLVLPSQNYDQILEKLENLKEYNIIQKTVSSLSKETALVSVFHK